MLEGLRGLLDGRMLGELARPREQWDDRVVAAMAVTEAGTRPPLVLGTLGEEQRPPR